MPFLRKKTNNQGIFAVIPKLICVLYGKQVFCCG